MYLVLLTLKEKFKFTQSRVKRILNNICTSLHTIRPVFRKINVTSGGTRGKKKNVLVLIKWSTKFLYFLYFTRDWNWSLVCLSLKLHDTQISHTIFGHFFLTVWLEYSKTISYNELNMENTNNFHFLSIIQALSSIDLRIL